MKYFAQLTRKRDLIRLRNRSKLVQGSLYAIMVLLIGAKPITLSLIWHVGFFFLKNLKFRKAKVLFYYI